MSVDLRSSHLIQNRFTFRPPPPLLACLLLPPPLAHFIHAHLLEINDLLTEAFR
jgi:hypothetical protein